MPTVETHDGAEIFYKDWGDGPPVIFIHGWPLNADAWDDQLNAVAEQGFRAIAHDRRGHGRSTQTWYGNDNDTWADDLSRLIETLDLRGVTLVAHSMGGGELSRYVGRHGTSRLDRAVLLAAVPPLMLRTASNPEGTPIDVFDGIREGMRRERSQFWQDLTETFFGSNRPGNNVTQGNKDAFWLMAMRQGLKAGLDCVKQFSETDFTEDLGRFDIPTLVVHGDDDQIVPIEASARKSAEIIPDATLKVYPGAGHGLANVPGDKEKFNEDLLNFLKG
ncbi:alpha/beta hydrolase [Actinopolyspora erythraea]|uniref:Alpha/beta hydrolase n=1 Tax=Actinopolyspora erythraea TaxID=414996 RepID=A0A099D7E6_9ACTN|nr:alpha/beta hydrolase [Actinopolyspora erythraea]ASU78807.1 alpha/beta hydrolase [Actinopolyspora erythraea]KGI81325.1 alpha/beta hydrolase [Actinopolyspora erythraea]